MQQVLGYSPMKTGVAYLAVAGGAILWSTVAAQLVTRIGVRPVLVTGMVALTERARVLHAGLRQRHVCSPTCCRAFCSWASASASPSCRSQSRRSPGSSNAETGLASGLFNTTQQIGGALGIAVLSTIATSRTSHALADGTAPPSALVHGFTGAFVVGAGIAAVGIVAALTLIRRDELEQASEELAPVQAPEELEPVLDHAA